MKTLKCKNFFLEKCSGWEKNIIRGNFEGWLLKATRKN